MRISDWSSDVCSSDLEPDVSRQKMHVLPSPAARSAFPYDYSRIESLVSSYVPQWRAMGFDAVVAIARGGLVPALMASTERSEERRVGKGCVSTCRSRGARYH